jgi:hypothetical protein
MFQAFEKRNLELHQFIWFYTRNFITIECEHNLVIYEKRLDQIRQEQKFSFWYWENKDPWVQVFRTTVGRIIFCSLIEKKKQGILVKKILSKY